MIQRQSITDRRDCAIAAPTTIMFNVRNTLGRRYAGITCREEGRDGEIGCLYEYYPASPAVEELRDFFIQVGGGVES